MGNEGRKRKRPTSAYQLDNAVQKTCASMLLKNKKISARSVAKALNISTSTITRDSIRSKLVVDATRLQMEQEKTISKQLKSSRHKDAEIIAAQKLKIEKLSREKHALLLSHIAMYGAIRESGNSESYQRFLEKASSIKEIIREMDGFD